MLMEYFFFTKITLGLLLSIATICFLILTRRKKEEEELAKTEDDLMDPPQPRRFPVIGHLHLLAGYEIPYQAFAVLRKKYGDIVRLQLGGVKSLMVSGHKSIREILVTKGHHFDSRPNFQRYSMLFSGDKENSLAFCDWTERHKLKRDLIKIHTFPRAFTQRFNSLESIIVEEADLLASTIGGITKIKPHLLKTVANIFSAHFCSKSFDWNDPDFNEMLKNFDEIFYEVNQGYAADFLPFLLPFHTNHLERINQLAHSIREFVTTHIISDRFDAITPEDDPKDYVDTLIKEVKYGSGVEMTWEAALFALEDILGGHSAIANFLVKLLAYIVKENGVQEKIQQEIDSVTYLGDNIWRKVNISDRNRMPYTEGAIFESIRLVASAIVPRVANQDSSVNGYRIKKDTLIFLDNYDLSMSEELWSEPHRFRPERFLVNNRLTKPEYFLPFGGGRRGCMGYKMVQLVGFGVFSALMQRFTILPVDGEDYKVPVGSLALPMDTFAFNFVERDRRVLV